MSTTILTLVITTMTWGQVNQANTELHGEKARSVVPGAAMVLEREGTEFPSHVRLAQDQFVSLQDFESYIRSSFEFSEEYTFEMVKQKENVTGLSLKAFQIHYQGIPIEHAVVIAHYRNGKVERYNGFADHLDAVALTPTVTESAGLNSAMNSIGAQRYLWEVPEEENYLKKMKDDVSATHYPEGKLIYVEGEDASTGYHLAWQYDIREANHLLDRRIFVDAATGEVLKWYPLSYNCNGGTVETTWHGTRNFNTDYDGDDDVFYLLDDCGAAEIHTVLEAGDTDITNDDNDWDESNLTDYATTHFYGRVTIDYFAAVHGRASYDDSDGDLLMRHVAGWANAQYIGSGTLRFGENTGNQGEFYNTLDVVSHEFVHAVTDNNGLGGLVYQGESGALNESFSDILGETTELWFENGAYTVDWLHREDYVNGENRSFVNPKNNGDPDTYLGDNWAPTCGGCGDAGGVHTNSGVMNHWFYLVTVGGSGENDNNDEFDVEGLGDVATREIAYRMLTEEMTSNATYADARTAAINITIDIYGDCSYELKQVMNAWYAVGVGNAYCEAILESPEKPGGFNISCNGGSDGEIDLTPLGTPPFTYAWDDGPTTQDRSGLAAGSYGVTLTDATGCTDYQTITLTEPPVLSLSASVTSDYNGYAVSCFGGSDGIATASASGGAPPYSYQWDANADNQGTAVATALSAGTYDVMVTDANGCVANAQVTLDEPPPLTIEAGDNQTVYYGYPPAECASLSYSGAGGGVPPYSYSWSTGENDQDIEVCPMVSTMYYITITDANGCTATDSVIVCAIDVRCGNKLDKVEICHFPPDYPENKQTLCVALNSVEEHLSHGDSLAACGTVRECTDLLPKAAPAGSNVAEASLKLQANPNPFSSITTLTFSAEKEGQATLRLVDAYGATLETLFSRAVYSNAPYTVELNGDKYPPGLYFCVLQQSDGNMKVIKLILKD